MRPSASDSRHPGADRPYFEEYAPLFPPKKPGAVGFRPEFSYDSFFMESQDAAPQLTGYLRLLESLAHTQGTAAAFKFCRSLARIPWMRAAFPDAAHVAVLRDPWGQWTSGWRIFHESANPYFLVLPLRILTRHAHRELVATALDVMKIRAADLALPSKHAPCCAAVRSIPASRLYRAFLAFWMCTTMPAARDAELVIESDRLSFPEYRVRIERELESLTGIAIDLSGSRPLYSKIPADEPFGTQAAHADALDGLHELERLTNAPVHTSQLLRDKLTRPRLPIAI